MLIHSRTANYVIPHGTGTINILQLLTTIRYQCEIFLKEYYKMCIAHASLWSIKSGVTYFPCFPIDKWKSLSIYIRIYTCNNMKMYTLTLCTYILFYNCIKFYPVTETCVRRYVCNGFVFRGFRK